MGVPSPANATWESSPVSSRARMRGALLLLPLLGCASALPQGGFLSGIGNAFNNFFGGDNQGSRPPPRQAQRPRPQQPPRFQQQPQQQFQPQPQQQFQQQQQQFQPQPPRQQFQQQQQPAAPSFNPRPTAAPAAPPRLVGGTSLCGAAAPNHFWTDPRDNVQRGYVATWKIGCSTFQQH